MGGQMESRDARVGRQMGGIDEDRKQIRKWVMKRNMTYISHNSWKQNKSMPSTVNTTTFHIILLPRVHRLDIYLQLLGLRTSISSQDQEQGSWSKTAKL